MIYIVALWYHHHQLYLFTIYCPAINETGVYTLFRHSYRTASHNHGVVLKCCHSITYCTLSDNFVATTIQTTVVKFLSSPHPDLITDN